MYYFTPRFFSFLKNTIVKTDNTDINCTANIKKMLEFSRPSICTSKHD